MSKRCKSCGYSKYKRHAPARCQAAKAEKRVRARGLVPIRGYGRWPAIPFRADNEPNFHTTRTGARSALLTLGLPAQMHKTWHGQVYGGPAQTIPECWTTADARDKLEVVQDIAIRFLRCSLPEAARRLMASGELFAEYDARRRLGEDSEALDALLHPLQRGRMKRITNAQLKRIAARRA